MSYNVRLLTTLSATVALALVASSAVAQGRGRGMGGGSRSSGGGSGGRSSGGSGPRSGGSGPRSPGGFGSRSGGPQSGPRPLSGGSSRGGFGQGSPRSYGGGQSFPRGSYGGQRTGGFGFPGRGDSPRNYNPSVPRGSFGRSGGYVGGIQRSFPSRSGVVRYGTTSNGFGRRYTIGRAPAIGTLGGLVRRSGGAPRGYAFGGVYNGLRVGYTHYNRGWRDDYFCYPHYVFNPYGYAGTGFGVNVGVGNFGVGFVYSPWYYYSYLPPYIDNTRVVYVNNFPPAWDGVDYNYRPPVDNDDDYEYRPADRERDNRQLDFALDDISAAFTESSRRAVDRLIPRDGKVNIYVDGRYSYSLNPDDFDDLFLDGIDSAKTQRYEIESVKWNGSNAVRVHARHDYVDPWGAPQTLWHSYYLEQEGRDFVIREFGTSKDRP